MKPQIRLASRSPADTRNAGEAFARHAAPGDFFALFGELGAGKTEWVKGMARGLGVPDPDLVCSPTFVLAATYAGRLPLRHVDAFRLRGPEDLESLGFEEWIQTAGVTVLEWSERAQSLLPADRMEIRLEHLGEDSRRITCRACGPRSEALLHDAAKEVAAMTETDS